MSGKLRGLRQIGVLLIVGGSAVALLAQTGFSRVVLQDQPVSAAGRHGVTARAEFAPGASAGLHSHPGEEFGYIVEGAIALSVDGVRDGVVTSPPTAYQGSRFRLPEVRGQVVFGLMKNVDDRPTVGRRQPRISRRLLRA
jgi:Cupin domain